MTHPFLTPRPWLIPTCLWTLLVFGSALMVAGIRAGAIVALLLAWLFGLTVVTLWAEGET